MDALWDGTYNGVDLLASILGLLLLTYGLWRLWNKLREDQYQDWVYEGSDGLLRRHQNGHETIIGTVLKDEHHPVVVRVPFYDQGKDQWKCEECGAPWVPKPDRPNQCPRCGNRTRVPT